MDSHIQTSTAHRKIFSVEIDFLTSKVKVFRKNRTWLIKIRYSPGSEMITHVFI